MSDAIGDGMIDAETVNVGPKSPFQGSQGQTGLSTGTFREPVAWKPKGPINWWIHMTKCVSEELRGRDNVPVNRNERNRIAKERWEKMSLAEREQYQRMVEEMYGSKKRKTSPSKRSLPSKQSKAWIRTCCSLRRICKLKRHIFKDPFKKQAVRKMGFYGVTVLKAGRMDREFMLKVIRRYDARREEMLVDKGVSLKVSEEEVSFILGIPKGQKPLPGLLDVPEAYLNGLKRKYLVSLKTLFDMIVSSDAESLQFKQATILFIVNVFLVPSSSNRVSMDSLQYAYIVDDAASYNWASLVLDVVRTSVGKWQEEERRREMGKSKKKNGRAVDPSFRGCIFFLLLFYLHHSDKGVSIQKCKHPIGAWDQKAIRLRIDIERDVESKVKEGTGLQEQLHLDMLKMKAFVDERLRVIEGGVKCELCGHLNRLE